MRSSNYFRFVVGAMLACMMSLLAVTARAQPLDPVVEAREALRKKDRSRLSTLRAVAIASQNPLAMWADYWDATNRLGELQQTDLDAFYARWPGTYVEDRLRNDWLLELGRRRDWGNFTVEFPRFRMNDDREVTCYGLLTDHLAGKDIKDAARNAWFAQRTDDDGCALLASTLLDAKVLTSIDVWRKVLLAADAGRIRVARQAAGLISPQTAAVVQEINDSPARFLARRASRVAGLANAELTTVAIMRMAASDPDATASVLSERWERTLPPELASLAWASVAKQSAIKLSPDASDNFRRAESNAGKDKRPLWGEEALAWKVRAALRADNGKARWQQVIQAVDAMSPEEQADPAWVYWKARALRAIAPASQDGEALRAQARAMFASIADQLNFYGWLAAETIGQPLALPPRPVPLTPAEKEGAVGNPGLSRALRLIGLGLRGEGVREWNYTLRGMTDRQLLAAAQLACDRQIWDRCINTSDRTREEIDVDQRFPMPYRNELVARARETGIDPAYVYGLIRQESRFVMDARSSVGASGLMQIMPATARWTAKKIGIDYTGEAITDRDTNLRLGTGYLKLVLDDFAGSQPMAAAAYNAGPGRPRKWREGPWLEPAAWAENIPFTETRDYVKKVLSNASIYASLINGGNQSLRARLGRMIGPRDADAPPPNTDLP